MARLSKPTSEIHVPPTEPRPELLPNPLARYVLATRPGFLLAGMMPVFIGVAAAAGSGTRIHVMLVALTVVGALLVHAAVNVLNDYYDALNGTDEINTGRIFPFTGGSRMIQNGVFSAGQMAGYGACLLLVTVLLGLFLSFWAGPLLLWIGIAGIVLGWGYSAPPLQLNARGLGEISVAMGFGLLIPLGSYLVQAGRFDEVPLAAGLPYGLLVANLLYVNQFPDREADAASGKRHWVVRAGWRKGRWGYPLLAACSGLSLVLLVAQGTLPLVTLVALLALIPAAMAAPLVLRHAGQPGLLAPAIRLTIVAALSQGLLLSVTLAW